ncbi:hypothetical protein [Chelativorans sp. M5D2P16]|uniref:hypothetical protein n=1 Tax=Chelativorans sp. M5D2P16 TaxID=3095678 RepID=UPI002ACB0101|nr:hypothetical protein [Chelativorans sp. M5D2P16]MDZ5697815.1 hypothetical protein [Chelativorans sp. M5D2P16]
MTLPALISPKAVVERFAEAGIEISERELRRRARELRACRELGKALFFTEGDVVRIIEAAITPGRREKECQNSGSAGTSGTTLSPSPENAYEEARKRLTGKSRKTSHSATSSANVVPMSTAQRRN